MADQPISALVQIAAPTGTPPYPTAFTNPTTGAMVEILDTTTTTMASTGTNSRIAPGDLIKGYLAAGTGMTITETAGIVTLASSGGFTNPMTTAGDLIDGGSAGAAQRLAIGSTGQVLTVASGAPAWANPVTATSFANTFSSVYPCTGSFGNIGLSITITTAGTYMISATIAQYIVATAATLAAQITIFGLIYDSTNLANVTIASPAYAVGVATFQATGTSFTFQPISSLGPVIYTPASVPATLNVQAYQQNNNLTSYSYIDVGTSSIFAIRVS